MVFRDARRTLTLPTLRFSMKELIDAIAVVHGAGVNTLVRFEPQERIESLFGRFPPLETLAAAALGFSSDIDLTVLVRRAIVDD
jgi:hypothetical protein